MLNNISEAAQAISDAQKEIDALEELANKLQLKDETLNKLQLHEDKNQIKARYNEFSQKVDELEKITDLSISKKLKQENIALQRIISDVKSTEEQIKKICDTLINYGQNINAQRLLDHDHTELNNLKSTLVPEKEKEETQLKMAEEMITLLNRYQGSELVPIINLTVDKAKIELYKIRASAAHNRIFGLINSLEAAVKKRNNKLNERKTTDEKITELTKKSQNLTQLQDFKEKLAVAEEKHIKLQEALKTPLSQLLKQQEELNTVNGDITYVKTKIEQIKINKGTQEQLKKISKKRLDELENNNKKPMYEQDEEKIRSLYIKMAHLKEKTFKWSQILQDPTDAKKEFDEIGDNQGFGLKEYQIFVKSIGEYLGNQFEPVAYDYKFHNIQYFDIENNIFTTSENRKIAIDQLSKGQSKITTLTGSFKKMDHSRKKIVLIDEIADLDPENLQKVKSMLKEKLHDGSLILAVLVRPQQGSLSNTVEVRGWK